MLTTQKQIKDVANIYKAIGNRYRLQIISLLIDGEKNVGEINKSVKVSQPALSQNLKILMRAGLLGKRRENRKIYYFIKNAQVIRLIGIGEEMVKLLQNVTAAAEKTISATAQSG